MEFPLPVSPYLTVQNYRDYIFVDAAPAKAYNDTDRCLFVDTVNIMFYRMYLSERSFDQDTYFNGIINFMTLEKIRENGEEVCTLQII